MGTATLLPELGLELELALALPDAAVPLELPEPEPDEVVALPPLQVTTP